MRVVALPGGGTARVREVTGHDEDELARSGALPAALAVTRLIGACVEVNGEAASPERARAMLVGDRDYAMLQLRAETLGERIMAVASCPSCGINIDITFNANDVLEVLETLRMAISGAVEASIMIRRDALRERRGHCRQIGVAML